MLKKIIALMLATMLGCLMVACGESSDTQGDADSTPDSSTASSEDGESEVKKYA